MTIRDWTLLYIGMVSVLLVLHATSCVVAFADGDTGQAGAWLVASLNAIGWLCSLNVIRHMSKVLEW